MEVIPRFQRFELCRVSSQSMASAKAVEINAARIETAKAAAVDNPAYLVSTPKEDMQEIKRKNGEAKRKRHLWGN